MEKMTKSEIYRNAAALLEETAPRYAEILLADADRIDARNEKSRGRKYETKDQKENKHLAALVTDMFLTEGIDADHAFDTAEIKTAIGFPELTPQKMTGVMKLVDVVDKVPNASKNKNHVGYKVKTLA